MTTAIDTFIAELRADPNFAKDAQSIHDCIVALDREGEISPDAAGLYEAIYYVIRHPGHDVREKIAKCHELINRKGKQSGTLRELTGW
jgi:hypothetical protein